MPAFYILVGIGAVALWFYLKWIFSSLGSAVYKEYKDVKDIMNEEEEK